MILLSKVNRLAFFLLMRTNHKISLIVGSTILAAILGFLSQYVQNSIIDFSARQGFGFSPLGLTYIIVPIMFAFFAFILSLILININSLRGSFLISLLFSLFNSIQPIRDAFAIYMRENYFDKTYFQMDLFIICSNFVIYPLIAFAFWKAKELLTKKHQ
jgi:hypothetical protein